MSKKKNDLGDADKNRPGLSASVPSATSATIPIAPSLKTQLNARAQIDFCYFVLGEWAKSPEPPKHAVLVAMIDAATGKDRADAKELRKGTLTMLNCIIRNKKRIGEDYSKDVKCRDQINVRRRAKAIGGADEGGSHSDATEPPQSAVPS